MGVPDRPGNLVETRRPSPLALHPSPRFPVVCESALPVAPHFRLHRVFFLFLSKGSKGPNRRNSLLSYYVVLRPVPNGDVVENTYFQPPGGFEISRLTRGRGTFLCSRMVYLSRRKTADRLKAWRSEGCATKQTKLLLQRSCWGTFYLAVGVTFISAREINHKMSLECVYGCSHPLWGGAGECIEGDSCRCDVGYASRDLFGNPSCVPQKV